MRRMDPNNLIAPGIKLPKHPKLSYERMIQMMDELHNKHTPPNKVAQKFNIPEWDVSACKIYYKSLTPLLGGINLQEKIRELIDKDYNTLQISKMLNLDLEYVNSLV